MSEHTNLEYIDWARGIIDIIIDELEVSNGDAQSIVEAQEYIMTWAYVGKMSPEHAAVHVIEASNRIELSNEDKLKAALRTLIDANQEEIDAYGDSVRHFEAIASVDVATENAEKLLKTL